MPATSAAPSQPRSARVVPRLEGRAAVLLVLRAAVLVGVFLLWYALTATGVLPTFFFGRPLVVLQRVGQWFATGKIYPHLGVTLIETVLAFAVGTLLGVAAGLWLGLRPLASALLEPYIKAANAMPRVILAPIFAVWFGLGIASKVALGVTLVFFIVFFNVYQGVREVSPTVLASVRMLGASPRQLVRYVYLPSATSWVFSSLHTSVGMAFVGAVVGEYLGSAAGAGFRLLASRGPKDHLDEFLVGRIDGNVVQLEKDEGGSQRSTLVPVDERM